MEVTERCRVCRKESSNIKKCSKCKCAYYCSTNCQKKDWSIHKKNCTKDDRTYYKTMKKLQENKVLWLYMSCMAEIVPICPIDKESIITVEYCLKDPCPDADVGCFYFDSILKDDADDIRQKEKFSNNGVITILIVLDNNLNKIGTKAMNMSGDKSDPSTDMIIKYNHPEVVIKSVKELLLMSTLTKVEPLLIKFDETQK